MENRDIKKILYTPPRGIGDVMFSLPLLHSLREAYPRAQIYVPMAKDKQNVLDLVGFLKRTERYLPKPSEDPLARERWQASVRGDTKEKYRLEKEIYDKYLAGEEFDLALVPKDFTIDGINCNQQVCEPDLTKTGIGQSSPHIVDRFLRFVDYLNIPRVMSFELAIDKEKDAAFCSGWKIQSDKPYVVLQLAASVNKKVWSERGYSETASWCLNNGLNVVLVGDKESFEMACRIQESEKRVLNTVLRESYAFDLENVARLAWKAKAVVSPDTGVLHLSDAIGAKVIGLYGPTSAVKFGPYNNLNNVVSRFEMDQNVKNVSSKEVIKKLEEVIQR